MFARVCFYQIFYPKLILLPVANIGDLIDF